MLSLLRNRFGIPGVTALLALFVLAAPPAGASTILNPQGTLGSAAQPSFGNPEALAVDQASGDLLVIDAAAGTLSRFHADGTPSSFSALGTNVIDGIGVADETPQVGLTFGGASQVQVAVDNSGGASVTDGNIYVTQSDQHLIDIFSGAGEYLGQLTESSTGPFGESCGVAVDLGGDVYVGDLNGEMHKFAPLVNPPVNGDNVANFTTPNPCNLVAGVGPTAGSIFAVELGGAVRKLDSTTGALDYVVAAGSTTTASVDPASGHVYTASEAEAREYDASAPSGAILLTALLRPTSASGIAADQSSGRLYLTRSGLPNVEVFSHAVVPDPATGEATDVAGHSATLNGTVDPSGIELEECEFEYGATSAYGHTIACAETPAEIGAGEGPVAVHAGLTELASSSTYHFRLNARNQNTGQARNGADQTFSTLGPQIHAQSVSAITDTSAKLEAQIDPNGQGTAYRFDYVSADQFDLSGYAGASAIPAGVIGVGNGQTDVAVSQPVSGLQPHTAYHFRAVATNISGAVEGPDQAFSTYPTPLPGLPDGRAYEQASPVDKNGGNVEGTAALMKASADGDSVIFDGRSTFPHTTAASNIPSYLASRGGGQWSSQGVLPPESAGANSSVVGWLPDMSQVFLRANNPGGALVPNPGTTFLARSSAGGSLATIAPRKLSANDFFAGASADRSQVVFEATGPTLLPNAASAQRNLYTWQAATGELSLAGSLNDGLAPPGGAFAGAYDWVNGLNLSRGGPSQEYFTQDQHVVTPDGSVFFTAGQTGQIYLRRNPTAAQSPLDGDGECTDPDLACTVRISASQRTLPDPNGPLPAIFMTASADGSRAFFTSCEKLTDDSTAISTPTANCLEADQSPDLYVYDVSTGQLTDLTVDPDADVRGVLGTSADGSYVYFAANGVLAPGASPGDCSGTFAGEEGSCNLYLNHEGETILVARLKSNGNAGANSDSDGLNWAPTRSNQSLGGGSAGGVSYAKTARVSVDGRTLLFGSVRKLTEYDNQGQTEFYRFHLGEAGLTCVSCNPTGAPPTSGPTLLSTRVHSSILGSIPSPILSRNLSADGDRVFFESPEALVSSDTNGEPACPLAGGGLFLYPSCQDVYEWQAQGTGECDLPTGCIRLISTGKSSEASFLLDASESGDDVFFTTLQGLVGQDEDQLVDVYDARVGGGLPSQNPPPAPLPCEGEACKGQSSSAATDASPGSVHFSGPGNPKSRPCPKGKRRVRRSGQARCVPKHTKRHNRTADKRRRASR